MNKIYSSKNKKQIARPNTIRDINRQVILNYIREKETISRADLSKITDLQRSTVSIIVEELIKENFIEEIGFGVSTGGRKPKILRLQKGKPVVIGIDIAPTFTTIAVADLTGQILEKEAFPTIPEREEIFQKVVGKVKKIVEKTDNEDLKVGISLPGIVDDISGKVISVPFFQWKDWNLAEEFRNATNLSVTVDNDANVIALAEIWFEKHLINYQKNFITVLIAEGIGTGIIYNGEIYRGQLGAAGEFGHMIVGTDSQTICSCGSRKCWEAFASDKATIDRYKKLSNNKNGVTIHEIVDLAIANDAQALEAINQTLEYVCIGLSNLIFGLSPEVISICGEISRLKEKLVKELPKIINKNVRQSLPNTRIAVSGLGANPSLVGAISLALMKKFSSKTNTQ